MCHSRLTSLSSLYVVRRGKAGRGGAQQVQIRFFLSRYNQASGVYGINYKILFLALQASMGNIRLVHDKWMWKQSHKKGTEESQSFKKDIGIAIKKEVDWFSSLQSQVVKFHKQKKLNNSIP